MGSVATLPTVGVKCDFHSKEALPVTPEQVSKEWLSFALGSKTKDAVVVQEIMGTAGKILFKLTYEDNDGSAPTEICLKGGFNPALVQAHPTINDTYRREAEFFYYIAPLVQMRLPKPWYCGSDVVTGQGLVIMDDLAAQGCTFGVASETWTVERVQAGVEQLAILHALTWNATEAQYPWIYQKNALGANPLQGMIVSLMSAPAWESRFAEGEQPPVPESMTDRKRMLAAWKTLWRTVDPRFTCVVHGDCHVGNTFITPTGEPSFIDWQVAHVNSAFHDIGYFISGSLTVEDRRKSETALLDHYLKTLADLGGPKLERAEIWDEYRKQLLHGFAWALTDPRMQPKDIIFSMSERHATAIVDHGSLELLELSPEYVKEE
ncbi:kinase-like domain-containing protein [Xylariales sp. PMI_506]|nr:kinase-like domain-containing protein [Xylariales sp. PMI_506]